MFVIQITEETIPFITTLNGGVAPAIEEKPTCFIWRGEDTPPEIVVINGVMLSWIEAFTVHKFAVLEVEE